jgi:hypothetical protein
MLAKFMATSQRLLRSPALSGPAARGDKVRRGTGAGVAGCARRHMPHASFCQHFLHYRHDRTQAQDGTQAARQPLRHVTALGPRRCGKPGARAVQFLQRL